MTGLSRRERRALARENKRDRKARIKAEKKRADAERKASIKALRHGGEQTGYGSDIR